MSDRVSFVVLFACLALLMTPAAIAIVVWLFGL